MLQIIVPALEYYDEIKNEFVTSEGQTLQLEHSLLSISKWEAKWNKAFLTKHDKTFEETIDYIKCMTISRNIDPSVYERLTSENIAQINDYIGAPMTATYFREEKSGPGRRDVITSELIYYWMIALGIPFECQKWHFNRLLTLIRVCNIKNSPPKKMSQREIMRENAALNAARKKRLKTNG